MGKALALLFATAAVAGVAAFVAAGLASGQYPFGPDERPMCSGTPDGIPAGCRYGELDERWLDPFLWPAIIAFVLVLVVGIVLVRRLDIREPTEPI